MHDRVRDGEEVYLIFQSKPTTNNNTLANAPKTAGGSVTKSNDKPSQASSLKKGPLSNGANAGIGISVLDQLLPAVEASQDSSNSVQLSKKNVLADFDNIKRMKKEKEEMVGLTAPENHFVCFQKQNLQREQENRRRQEELEKRNTGLIPPPIAPDLSQLSSNSIQDDIMRRKEMEKVRFSTFST